MPKKKARSKKGRYLFVALLGAILGIFSGFISSFMYQTAPSCFPQLPGAFPFYQYYAVPLAVIAIAGATAVAKTGGEVKLILPFIILFLAAYSLLGSLGVYSSSEFCPAGVLGASGYNFQGPASLTESGNMSLSIGQSSGRSIYNIGLGCTGFQTSTNTTNSTFLVYATGIASGVYAKGSNLIANPLSIASGQNASVYDLRCYWANGTSISGLAGAKVSGYIYISYTNASGVPSGSNQRTTELAGRFALRLS
ncbi:MAG: hypothetical protein KGH98_00690 [Candidatus Micrarchaeota archaeon]|nr:hypothetical protein [Candidatus Micrarchaeota archaeon]